MTLEEFIRTCRLHEIHHGFSPRAAVETAGASTGLLALAAELSAATILGIGDVSGRNAVGLARDPEAARPAVARMRRSRRKRPRRRWPAPGW